MEKLTTNNIIPNSGFADAFNNQLKKSQDILKNIEGLPMKIETFSISELKAIIEVRKQIDIIINEFYANYSDKDIDKKREYLNKIIRYLDTLNIWDQKFSTGDPKKLDENNDSLYYLTSKNISLRIKKALLQEKSLYKVIQPFMENISFSNGIYYPSEKAIINYIPVEYCSNNFHKIQSQNPDTLNSDFTSKVQKIYKDDRLYYIPNLNKEDLFHKHDGNPVGKIYF